ncbi:hypothetical protein F5Y17DRAFT_419770 [Xylariaceae sp. FL0594]|nr:hypothetical protein F5Y17DRAFT_419770 [Xylariaceae sp. FL0594]
MSQVAVAPGYKPGSATAALPNPDVDELREYQKIIQFRDTVISGKHPRFKVPALSVVKNATQPPSNAAEPAAPRVAQPSTQASANPPTGAAANGPTVVNMLSFKANSQQPAVNTSLHGPTSAPSIPRVSRSIGSGSGSGSGKPEINPVLLQKSDDLVKAEIQIQRQRIEKALKEQVEQRKAAMRTTLQPSEQLPDFDLSDILAKALTLVQATAPPPSTNLPSPNANNASEASDSFDENTFYSSQHDTPESRPSIPTRSAVEAVQMRDAPANATSAMSYLPSSQPTPAAPFPAAIAGPPHLDIPRDISRPQHADAETQIVHPLVGAAIPSQGHGLGNIPRMEPPPSLLSQVQRHREELEAQVISSDSRGASGSDNSGNTDSEQSADQRRLQIPQHLPNPHFRRVDEPLIRAHNLSPLAPQPSHVSPLAVARQQAAGYPDSGDLPRAPATQVNAHRQVQAVVISPESSPQGDVGSKKNKKKKNKRKADERVQDAVGSPQIKSEPRSPSPLGAPAYIGRQKRQRRSGRQEPEFIHDHVVLERPSSRPHHGGYQQPVPAQAERISQGYEVVDYPYPRQVRSSVAPVTYRPESPLYEERRADGSIIRYVRRVPSPVGYTDPYGVVEPRPQRTTSYTVPNPDAREFPAYEREGRMSVRPYGDRARSRSPVIVDGRSTVMPPPSVPRRRILVDEYGREYLEPVRASNVSRQSVMPHTRPADHERVYDRAPIQVTPREIVGEDGVVYRRASPGYAPRRVATQPDLGTNYRSYRERDYSIQPTTSLGHEFVQIRGASEHRGPELMPPRDYLPRATSVRPAMEPMPYNRLSSSRPDVAPRQYTASVHPEARRDVAPHVVREYSVRPTEMDVPQRAYSVRPVERYYEEQPRESEVAYFERPRQVHQEIVYPGNGSSNQMYQ